MSELAESGSVADGRRDALTPYLDILSASIGAVDGADGQIERQLPPRLDLDHWEANALEQGLRAEDHAADAWETLLAEGVALQAKYLVETQQLDDDDALQPELREQVQDQLTQTAAIGLALQVEIQRAVDAMILGGQMNHAKRLTLFRNKLGQMVGLVGERIGQENFALAKALGESMVSPEAPQVAPVAPVARLEEPTKAPPRQAKFDKFNNVGLAQSIEVTTRTENRSKPLLIFFAIVVTAWTIFIAPRLFKSEVPALTQADLAFAPAIQEIRARPPSLFLVVDRGAWEGMATGERQDLVLQIGQTVEAVGYTGVNVRLDDGTTVGQWSIKQGAKLNTPQRVKS